MNYMNEIIDLAQLETFKIYKKKYSKKYIREKLLPIVDYINDSSNKKFLFSGSQGIGKTSLIKIITIILEKMYGKKTLILSLDDYYYSKKYRLNLARKINPLLITRGVPGTHKIRKLTNDVKKYDKSSYPINIPIFDKLIDDNLKKKKIIRKKVDILILEGWCCGCTPIGKDYLYKNINELEKNLDKNYKWRNYYNNKLRYEYKQLFNLFNEKIFIKAPSFKYVIDWRLKQELNNFSRSKNSKKMNVDEIKHFIQHYEKITKWMIKSYKNDVNFIINVDKKQKILVARKTKIKSTS